MKLKKPSLPSELQKLDNLQDIFDSDTTTTQVFCAGQSVESIRSKSLCIKQAKLNNIVMQDVEIRDCGMDDIILYKCELPALKVPKLSGDRIEFMSCRMSGVQIYESTLRDVLFQGSKLDLANFRFAKLKNVIFDSCELKDIDFIGVEFDNVKLVNCELENADFSNSKIIKLDLRSNQLNNIKGIMSLKGAIVSSSQLIAIAPQLAIEAGLIVQDD